jgi:hypothetical protein
VKIEDAVMGLCCQVLVDYGCNGLCLTEIGME